jgi:TonB family protein
MQSIILKLIWVAPVLLMPSCAGPTQVHPSGVKPVAGCQPEIVRDTAQYTLYLTPPRSVPEARLHPESYAPYLRAVARKFTAPVRLRRVWSDSSESSRACGPEAMCGLDQRGEIQISLDQGRVTVMDWYQQPYVSELEWAMEAAIRRADSSGLLPRDMAVAGLPAGTVRLGIELARVTPPGGFFIGVIPIQYIRVTTPARAISQAPPVFPEVAKRAGLSGQVTLQYVIDQDGTARSSSIRVIEPETSLFTPAAVEAIRASRFEPARSGHCRIPLWVEQTIRFKIDIN